MVFTSGREGARNLYWQSVERPEEAQRLAEAATTQFSTAVSPDGNRVVFVQDDDLHVLVVDEARTEPLFETPFREFTADISPDGRWIAYDSDESGTREVYVRPFPNVLDNRWTISAGGGTRPVWAASGEELFYMRTDDDTAAVVSVPVEPGDTWSAGQPATVFEGPYFFNNQPGAIGIRRTYDVTPDGGRFLMMKDVTPSVEGAPVRPEVNVVMNWYEELRARVPVP